MVWLCLSCIFLFLAHAFDPAAISAAWSHISCIVRTWLRQYFFSRVLDKHGPEGLDAFARAVDMVYDITPLPTFPAESSAPARDLRAPRVSEGRRRRRAKRWSVSDQDPTGGGEESEM